MADKIQIFLPGEDNTELPLSEGVRAGFLSPAEDFQNGTLNITQEIVKNPASTFYAKVNGTSMIDDGIADGDILVVDKSVEPYDGCIAICFVDGEFTLKHVEVRKDCIMLVPANKAFKPIKVTPDEDFIIWGIARYVIKKLK
ncbi:MAG: translesion error-prone DNA polymerase V autoproteolytic subunit [Bacteroidales bacterium]|jgi:DNA polymerase V|nr:translesion error-prone DNA polymerase V autoproteolytic subunit [Bacteroidales bacterium]MCI2122437.1 translesion error-prone DNA polymerase V autoproteolytic subunit [Bacteroidales bacterium]MCI2145943.1 translesion error-prone DNA polymerase V autoproteolytic subunit [Bacteroidales bacterium]